MAHGHWIYWIQWLLFGVSCVLAYEVPISESDWSRQVCSGMWGNEHTYINGMYFPADDQRQMALTQNGSDI